MACADALDLAVAKKESALSHAEELETRIAALNEELQSVKQRKKEESA